MRGHGTLQQLLGKRVTSNKKTKTDPDAGSSKRQNTQTAAAAAAGVAASAKGQKKLQCFGFQMHKQASAAGCSSSPTTVAAATLTIAAVPSSTAAAALPDAATDQFCFTIHTKVVGRRHQVAKHPPPFAGNELVLVREPDNPVDPCAILICSRTKAGAMRPTGHLPASVASHLAALLDEGLVDIKVRLAQPPEAATSSHVGSLAAKASAAVAGSVDQVAAASTRHLRRASSSDSSRSSSSKNSGGSGDGGISRTGSSSLSRRASPEVELSVSLAKTSIQSAGAARPVGGVTDVVAAVEQAVVAGAASLEPSRSSGAVLSASFEHILQQTRQHDLHLLDEQEQAVLTSMGALAAPAKALLLRLLLRKRTWFQLDSLNYLEVPQPAAAAQQLCALGLLVASDQSGMDLHSLLSELPMGVLRQVLAALLPKNHPAVATAMAEANNNNGGPSGAAMTKAALINSIQANACPARLQSAITAAAGVCVMVPPSVANMFTRLQRMYFISPGQDLGMFLAVDRGAIRYPSYTVSRTRPIFHTRAGLLDYEQALELAAQVDQALEEGDTAGAWQLLQPALAALQAGIHKTIVWDESQGAMPNPPPQIHRGMLAVQASQQLPTTDTVPDVEKDNQQADVQYQQQPMQNSTKFVTSNSQLGSQPCNSDQDSSQPWQSSCTSNATDAEELSSPTTADSIPGVPAKYHSKADGPATAQTGPARGGVQIFAAHTAAPATATTTAAAGPPPLFLARFCAGWVYASLGTVAVSLLEKQKDWARAVELLRLLLGGNANVGHRGDWWNRLAINLEHQGLAELALEVVECAVADNWVRWGDLLGLQRRWLRLGKPPRRWKRPPWAPGAEWEPREVVITGRPLNCMIGAKSRFYSNDGDQVGVEELALQHYASQEGGGWKGLHTEGGIWATLFGLLLWDVLFMGVPDVFRSPFQVAPLDLNTDAFYPARRAQLDQQLSRLADGEAAAILSATWPAHAGVMCRGVNWQRFDKQQLLDICDCIGGLGLAAVLRLMAEDHAGATGGLPDLLLWRPADRSAKVVEVKGPRDRLSHQQRFWLAHMTSSNIQVEVCKVKEPQGSSRSSK